MKWLMVGKTVVPFEPDGKNKPMFVLVDETSSWKIRRFLTLGELASAITATRSNPNDEEIRMVKNDLPAIIWWPDDTLSDVVLECERLDKQTLRDLVRLLRA